MATEQVTRNENVGTAIGRIPSGVFVVTAQNSTEKVGMLASWVMQVGFEPPTISVAIHPDRELYKVVQETGKFTVNVLSKENGALMKAFSKYSPDQFEQVTNESTEYGITLKDAVAVMECRVLEKVAVADHHLFVAEVVNGGPLDTTKEPMVHLRKSGFNY